jgi:hypothetical protein
MDEAAAAPTTGSLITPRKRKFRYLPDVIDREPGESPLSSLASCDVAQSDFGKHLVTAFHSLEQRFSAFQVAVGEDVDALFYKLQEIKAGMGVKPATLPLEGFNNDCITIWEAMRMLSGCALDPTRIQHLESTLNTLGTASANLSSKVASLEGGHGELSELSQLLSFEQDQLSQTVARLSGTGTSGTITEDLQALQQQVSMLLTHHSASSSSGDLGTLQAQLKLVKARLPSDPFVIGGKTFNSKADVALFVEKEVSGLSFSLFRDPLTLLESITDGHTKKSDVMEVMYQASRVGFDEDEATHIHSFKLIVPSLLGATKEGDKNDPKYPLPAVRAFHSWNPQDNEGGVKKRLQDGMDDISLAVMESINVACVDHPAAGKLATEMLYQTQVFMNDLCSWVDSFFMELINTSQVPAAEAWLLVASCIRKFCEVLHKFRAPADRAASKMDSTTRTTAYLWAMFQVHREMKAIRGHNFRGHPAVAPVITLHVFKTRVTTSAFAKLTEMFKLLDKRVTDTQKNFDKIHDRLSKLEKRN